MRVTVCGDRRTSKTTVWYHLDLLNADCGCPAGTHVSQVLVHHHDPLHALAGEWAASRDKSVIFIGGPEIGPHGPVATLNLAWANLFRLYVPDVLLSFGKVPDLVEQLARAHDTEIRVMESVYENAPGRWKQPREKRICGVLSPSKKHHCTRFLGHSGRWHWEVGPDGKRICKWRGSGVDTGRSRFRTEPEGALDEVEKAVGRPEDGDVGGPESS